MIQLSKENLKPLNFNSIQIKNCLLHRLKENLNQKASTTSFFYTLLDLANMSYDHSENEINHSLSSETYKVPEVRYVLGTSKEVVELKN